MRFHLLSSIFRSILNGLDELPSHVLVNLYEGLIKEQQAVHECAVHHRQQSVNRYINRLQDTTSSLMHLKFDSKEQKTNEQQNKWSATERHAEIGG